MNKTEVILKVAERSGVPLSECEKVLDAFGEVFNDELDNSSWKAGLFDRVYKIMDFLRKK